MKTLLHTYLSSPNHQAGLTILALVAFLCWVVFWFNYAEKRRWKVETEIFFTLGLPILLTALVLLLT